MVVQYKCGVIKLMTDNKIGFCVTWKQVLLLPRNVWFFSFLQLMDLECYHTKQCYILKLFLLGIFIIKPLLQDSFGSRLGPFLINYWIFWKFYILIGILRKIFKLFHANLIFLEVLQKCQTTIEKCISPMARHCVPADMSQFPFPAFLGGKI